MRVLAVESSAGDTLGLALYDADAESPVIAERELAPGRALAEAIVPALADLLASAGWDLSHVDLWACGLGPGSFTGARIGIATLKGIALATKRPLFGVSAFACVDPGPSATDDARLMLFDAGRGELFVSAAQGGEELLPPSVVARGALLDVIAPQLSQPRVLVAGPAATEATMLLPGLSVRVVSAAPADRPRASRIAVLAVARARAGEAGDAAPVVPLYVRPPDITEKRPKSSV